MTKAISMAIELDHNIMVTNMCVKFSEDWTHTFQELDRKTYDAIRSLLTWIGKISIQHN